MDPRVDLGHVLTAEVVLPESRYDRRPPRTRAVTEIVRQLAATPGVEAAAWVTTPPLEPRGGLGPFPQRRIDWKRWGTACLLPARRAARLDPAAVLREP
jgi:hypothetical protein